MISFDTFERRAEQIFAAVAILGGLGLIFATVVTCVSILLKLLRRGLDAAFGAAYEILPWSFIRPILGEEELVTYGVGLALFTALPWVMIQKGHIKIDLFKARFSDDVNRLLDLIADVTLAVLAYLIMTRQWHLIFKKPRRSQEQMIDEVLSGNWSIFGERLRDTQESQILGIPLWPTYVVAEICVVLFFLAAMFCVLRSARALIRRRAS